MGVKLTLVFIRPRGTRVPNENLKEAQKVQQ